VSTRRTLPDRRRSTRWHVHINGSSLFVTLGYYPEGDVGEVFLDTARYGAALRTWVEDSARLLSVGLQHGVPVGTLCRLFRGSKSDPYGAVDGHPDIRSCTSVMDFVAQLLEREAGDGGQEVSGSAAPTAAGGQSGAGADLGPGPGSGGPPVPGGGGTGAVETNGVGRNGTPGR
jgi:hypothetical protein